MMNRRRVVYTHCIVDILIFALRRNVANARKIACHGHNMIWRDVWYAVRLAGLERCDKPGTEQSGNPCHDRAAAHRPEYARLLILFRSERRNVREHGIFDGGRDRNVARGTHSHVAKKLVLLKKLANFRTDRDAVHQLRTLGVIQAPIEIGDDRIFDLIDFHSSAYELSARSSVLRPVRSSSGSSKISISSTSFSLFGEDFATRD